MPTLDHVPLCLRATAAPAKSAIESMSMRSYLPDRARR
jgi:hypothetical protein